MDNAQGGPKSSETPFCKGNPSSNGFECAGVVDWLSPVLFKKQPAMDGGKPRLALGK